MEKKEITIKLNGKEETLLVAPNELLLSVLRETLHLTGAKYVCGIGECGACTVQVEGKPVLSCLTLAAAMDGAEITTIEGLAEPDGSLDPVQEAYLNHGAYQCGYCTPGLVMASKSLLQENPQPTEEEIREYLRGNLCRCTGYTSIVRAVQGASVALERGNGKHNNK